MDASPEKLVELFSSMIFNASKGFVEINVEKNTRKKTVNKTKETNKPTKGGVGCRPSLNSFLNTFRNVADKAVLLRKYTNRQDQFGLHVPTSC